MCGVAKMKYQKEQLLVFGCMFVGYAFYILCRKSFSFLIPVLTKTEPLSNEDLGLIVSAQNMAYAMSKFAVGVLSDKVSARVLFSVGLVGAGLSLVGFSSVGSVFLYCGFWFFNGLLSGCGWPACSKLLRFWFLPEQFGTFWSLLSASMNVTGVIVPLCLPWLLRWSGGWRESMAFAGILSCAWGVVCFVVIKNCPEDMGLAPIGVVSGEKKDSAPRKEKQGWGFLVRSPMLWLLSVYYLVVFASRTSVENWAQLLLVKEKGVGQEEAGHFVSAYETGGFVSSLITGYITDWAVANYGARRGANPRMLVGLVYMAFGVVAIHLITMTNSMLPLLSFALGAFLYGNINIFGIVATEAAPPHLSGSSHAVVALCGSIGAVFAGLPITYLASYVGWIGVFYVLELAGAFCVFCMLVTLNMETKIAQKED